MLRELEYPFDSEQILKKSKKMKKQLLSEGSSRIKKKIAVLGGSTTHDLSLIHISLHHPANTPKTGNNIVNNTL